MKYVVILLFAISMFEDHIASEHLICKRVQGIFSQEPEIPRTRNVFPELSGPKGEAGYTGALGPPGRVDYATVNATIDEKANPAIYTVIEKIERLSSRFNKIRSQIGESRRLALLNANEVDRQALCKVWFEEKCYWAVVKDSRDVIFDEAKHLCDKDYGHLANLYNGRQYKKISAYLRGLIPRGGRWKFVQVHLGMAVVPRARSVLLRDGSPAPFLPWYDEHPYFYPKCTHTQLTVRKNKTSTMQGIHDYYPHYFTHGALCEI